MTDKHYSISARQEATYLVLGDRITFKLTGAETQGKVFIIEIVNDPGGGPAFLHTHPPQETFHVLEGRFEIYGRDASGQKYTIPAGVGDLVHVPGGVPHGFKNVGDGEGRLLVVYEPADMMRNFFMDIGIPMPDRTTLPALEGPPDVERAIAILRKHGMELIEMPPGA